MKGRIIKTDLTDRMSYTITDDTDGILQVVRNINSAVPEPYEGICPEGKYLTLAAIARFGETFDIVDVKNGIFTVDKDGRYTVSEIPNI
jgi:hypothetical protein